MFTNETACGLLSLLQEMLVYILDSQNRKEDGAKSMQMERGFGGRGWEVDKALQRALVQRGQGVVIGAKQIPTAPQV